MENLEKLVELRSTAKAYEEAVNKSREEYEQSKAERYKQIFEQMAAEDAAFEESIKPSLAYIESLAEQEKDIIDEVNEFFLQNKGITKLNSQSGFVVSRKISKSFPKKQEDIIKHIRDNLGEQANAFIAVKTTEALDLKKLKEERADIYDAFAETKITVSVEAPVVSE